MPREARLGEEQVQARLARLEGWQRHGDSLSREYRFGDFRSAIDFVVRVAAHAQALDHHPDIDVRYDRVRLVLTTHDAQGLTGRDFELARRIDA